MKDKSQFFLYVNARKGVRVKSETVVTPSKVAVATDYAELPVERLYNQPQMHNYLFPVLLLRGNKDGYQGPLEGRKSKSLKINRVPFFPSLRISTSPTFFIRIVSSGSSDRLFVQITKNHFSTTYYIYRCIVQCYINPFRHTDSDSSHRTALSGIKIKCQTSRSLYRECSTVQLYHRRQCPFTYPLPANAFRS